MHYRVGRVYLFLFFIPLLPFKGACAQEGESNEAHPTQLRIKHFKAKLKQHPPSGPPELHANPQFFHLIPLSSGDVLDVWIYLLQPLGFSLNQSKFKNFLDPLPDEKGKSQGACWTDIAELNPEEAFHVTFAELKLPLVQHQHYGFQLAARWYLETTEKSVDSSDATSIENSQLPIWRKMRAEAALMIYERGERGSWTASSKDYNPTPVLVWLEKNIKSRLRDLAH